MGVRQKPDAVFSQPVETLVPELAGATATDENGRVGGELVFWGYELGDGRPVFLFACAPSEIVNCDERVQLICVGPDERDPQLHGRRQRSRGASAPTSAVAAPGELRPGCIENEDDGAAGRRARELRLRPAGSALAGAARVTIHLPRRGRSWRSSSR